MTPGKECATTSKPTGQPLGEYLANVRSTKQMSLRDVEEAANGIVSNAYLSQLEHGRISKPSPNILHGLAQVYGVSYEVLMEKAGYIAAAAPDSSGSRRHGRVPTFAKDNLTTEEEEALLEYLAFLRSKKGKRS
jgi:transcriptional regulator with XRE-family HTH domain